MKIIILAVTVAAIGLVGVGLWAYMIRMPGKNFTGKPPAPSGAETWLQDNLRRHVEKLAGELGERNLVFYEALSAAAEYLASRLTETGYDVRRQEFQAVAGGGLVSREAATVRSCQNLEVEIRGRSRPNEIVVVGAHYDSAPGTPGANDNATGTAALLELASSFADRATGRTLRLVFFVNEEPPYFQTPSMGSWVYAQRCRERGERITAMLSLETMGYFSDEPGSQKYPFPIGLFYPSKADFLGFVGNTSSRALVHQAIQSFRGVATVPSDGVAAPAFIPGIGWSDQWSFWRAGYAGVMVTDTAPFRYPHYHAAADTPDKIDYDRLARVVTGVRAVVADLVSVE